MPRRISITSRKLRVVTIAAGGRLRVISAFVATVVPCEKTTTSRRSIPASTTPSTTASIGSAVDGTFATSTVAAVLVEDADVRERPSDVHRDTQARHWPSLTACRLRLITTRTETSLWHPFSDMAAVSGNEIVLERGEGVWLWDDQGNRYLDGSASLWYCNVGHGRAEIADAVSAQMKKLEAWSIFGDAATPPALELADRLSAVSSLDDAKIFLTTGGGDAIDTAAKLARLYWQVLGQPDRLHIVSRTSAYHGTMAFGTSLGGIQANRAGYGPLVASTSQVQWDSAEALRSELESLGPERVAAFFMEPVIGAGGVLPPPEGYVEAVAAICRDADVLFVCDSVICGFGRLGSWLGFERFGVQPDLVTFAKGVTSGYLPLGGVVVSGRVAEPFWTEVGRVTVRHGQTYSGHASACAAALANMDILERERLIERGGELEDELLATLAPLADHPLVAEVRGGTGALVGSRLRPGSARLRPVAPCQGIPRDPAPRGDPARSGRLARRFAAADNHLRGDRADPRRAAGRSRRARRRARARTLTARALAHRCSSVGRVPRSGLLPLARPSSQRCLELTLLD